MRKRAQRRSKPIMDEPKHIVEKTTIETKPTGVKKNWWVAVSLIGIFLLVLFLNSYFNITSETSINPEGKDLDKFYLSGPDPYYNMRLILYGEKAGHYPYYSDVDPLLDYPLGRSGDRPPLLNMFAIGFSRVLTPFMDEIDAVGYSMQFVPALFGALLIFPVYFIGKTLFGKRQGMVAAFLIVLIPIHIGSGHGSAYTLFDHDSLNLLLFFLAFLFLIKGIKDKDSIRSVLYALLSGVSLGALSMTWVEAQFLYVIIAVYIIVQMLIDIFRDKTEMRVVRTGLVVLFSGYLISYPVRIAPFGDFSLDIPLFLCFAVAAFGVVYLLSGRKKMPWTISLPVVFCVGIVTLVFLYFVNDLIPSFPFLSPLGRISEILYGSGIYGSKVAMTIAEAGTFGISRTVMSFGPAIYWIGWGGFVLILYRYYKDKQRRDYLFIGVLFILNIWLTSTAGRFLNDMVPLIAILGGWLVWMFIDWIDYKQMIRNIRSAGGGIHGLRRGVKVFHIFGILFIAFLVILPNAYLAFVAAVPDHKKADVFGDDAPMGVFGLGHYKEAYWVDAYTWLSEQDLHIEDPVERPAFISWWDYGFYEVAIGAHPTVADNFQDGIPTAANFHTVTSEKEAVSVWIIRLLEGDIKDNEGTLSEDVILLLEKYVGENNTTNITKWMEDPRKSPSYNTPIGEEYDEELSKEYRVGEQYPANAAYHDIVEIFNNTLDDEGITWLYHDIQEATGYTIRYYGVEGYDKQIFNIFGFLADKSLFLPAIQFGGGYNVEDDFVQVKVIFQSGKELGFDEVKELSTEELRADPPVITNGRYNTRTYYKDAYFETMFYRTYIGLSEGTPGNKQEPRYHMPCIDMRHFCAEFISEYSKYPSPYAYGKSAVVIAKYYEGAFVNGSITFMGDPVDAQVIVVKNITLYGTSVPIDHDKVDTNAIGNFSLIAPAGNITLQVRRYPELGVPMLGGNAFILKNVTFNAPVGSELAPIEDDEAMRINASNYERIVNMSIDPATIDGYAYLDKDNNSAYNASVDEPLSNVSIVLLGVEKINPTNYQPEQYDPTMIKELSTNETGHYNVSNLMPGYYEIRAFLDDFLIHANLIPLSSGNMSYNISKPKPAAVEGKVYYDTNGNDQYDPGEEMSNVDVELLYKTLYGDKKPVNKTITDETGSYSFSSPSLVPGYYILNATKPNSTTPIYLDYAAEKEIQLTENATLVENISLSLSLITVSGYTSYEDENIGGISIDFSPDGSIENNTAVGNSAVSNETTGYYEVELTPGSYNVSIYESEEHGTYSFEGQLFIKMGEGVKSYDISMTKHSVTVTGNITYDGKSIENVTVKFTPDNVENNTAESATTKSDENGSYIVELMPGSYIVSVDEKTITVNGQNVTCVFTGLLEIKVDDVSKSFDIELIRKES
jgi:dolichyl-diphosphooligosaccharide--protein glycosyltransferase